MWRSLHEKSERARNFKGYILDAIIPQANLASYSETMIKMITDYECVSVHGLGYVSLTLAAAWLRVGYRVLGVDILEKKVKELNDGAITFVDAKVKRVILEAVNNGRFKATVDGVQASKQSEVKVIAVPVGLTDDGQPILGSLEVAVKTLANGLKIGDAVILESSVPPGTTTNIVKPLLEETSGLDA
ncbi:unnamed protein product, partial [marine sediment metagenome]